MNIVIPAAGFGKRFRDVNYSIFPKPLIPIQKLGGKPMLQCVTENLNIDGQYIYIIQEEHDKEFYFSDIIRSFKPDAKIIKVSSPTEGAVCSVLLAEEFIDSKEELVIANSDQFLEWNSEFFLQTVKDYDAGVSIFHSSLPCWSFVKLQKDEVIDVAEKRPISNHACTGINWYKHGNEFVKYAKQMIHKNKRVNGEFYVMPVFSEYLEDSKKIKAFQVDRMWGLGLPELLTYFEEHYK